LKDTIAVPDGQSRLKFLKSSSTSAPETLIEVVEYVLIAALVWPNL